jgi:choline-sulfatase
MTGSADRPNFLIIMADEHAPQFAGAYGHPLVQSPNMDRLASDGVTFDSAYCNSPLCVPSRMSLMTGRLPSSDGIHDNASPLPTDVVTWPHLLRSMGYDVVLAGKQHFVGPDQLHGFRAQLAHDLHASALHAILPWGDEVAPADGPWVHLDHIGPGTTVEIETDEGVEAESLAYIRARQGEDRPWALMASFIAPHFPFVVPERYWSLYSPDEVDLPDMPPGHLERQHPLYARMRAAFGLEGVTEDQVRRARAAYYGLVTYLDDKIGSLLAMLDETGQADNTVVVYTADHGEMLGEHGLWRKSSFYEHSARVPLIVRWPGVATPGRRVGQSVSLVDLVATIVDAAGTTPTRPLDGSSLTSLLAGPDPTWKDSAVSEYLAHGVMGPMAMLRRGRYKFNYVHGEAPELYDLEADPGEFDDLSSSEAHRDVLEEMRGDLLSAWDPDHLDSAVRQGQHERLLIRRATGHDERDSSAAKGLVWGSAGLPGPS